MGGRVLLRSQPFSKLLQWLLEQLGIRIEGTIRVRRVSHLISSAHTDQIHTGFDEFMNLVVDDAIEVKQPTKPIPKSQEEAPVCLHLQCDMCWLMR